jgi:hypothetical protein
VSREEFNVAVSDAVTRSLKSFGLVKKKEKASPAPDSDEEDQDWLFRCVMSEVRGGDFPEKVGVDDYDMPDLVGPSSSEESDDEQFLFIDSDDEPDLMTESEDSDEELSDVGLVFRRQRMGLSIAPRDFIRSQELKEGLRQSPPGVGEVDVGLSVAPPVEWCLGCPDLLMNPS